MQPTQSSEMDYDKLPRMVRWEKSVHLQHLTPHKKLNSALKTITRMKVLYKRCHFSWLHVSAFLLYQSSALASCLYGVLLALTYVVAASRPRHSPAVLAAGDNVLGLGSNHLKQLHACAPHHRCSPYPAALQAYLTRSLNLLGCFEAYAPNTVFL